LLGFIYKTIYWVTVIGYVENLLGRPWEQDKNPEAVSIVLSVGDGQNTDPQSMDHPNGLPKGTTLKWTSKKILFQMSGMLRGCDYIPTCTLHGGCPSPRSASPSATILNNYTELFRK